MSQLLRIALTIIVAMIACYLTVVALAYALMAEFLLLPILFTGVALGAASGFLVIRRLAR